MAQFKLRQAHKPNKNLLSPKAKFEMGNTDFIPYCGYYNQNTIITKNGELMKVIRVTGFNHESTSSELLNLRQTLRSAISNHIKSDNFALWISTIRRKKQISTKSEFPDFFSKAINKIWNDKNNWDRQYVNELYITIIIEGYNTSISNLNSLLRSFSFSSTKKLHEDKLEISYKKLDNVVKSMMLSLNNYGAKVIGVAEFDGEIYSDPMRFFGKIVNLHSDRFPLTATDMSEELIANYEMAIGNNSLSVASETKKHYAAMFSIKEYQEISITALDRFLQLPQEFIITQSVDFINRNEALMELDYQNYILDVSKDEHMKELSGMTNIISSDSGSLTDFGKQQITLMLINENPGELSTDVTQALETLHELGLVTVREDIFSELCFWSQLPGNFSFLRRQKPINIGRIGGFASLHNFPAGNKSGNYWGDAVTIFRTIMGTPYFFNFHYEKSGHTMIIGPKGTGKTTLLNFLVAQSRKFKNKLYYFGANRSGKIFINAMGGRYFTLSKDLLHAEILKLSPLNLSKTPANKAFLQDWFFYLVNYGTPVDKKELDLIPAIVEKIISKDIKKLSEAAQFFKTTATQNIYKKLAPWHSDGKYAFIFDNAEEINFDGDLVNAFDLSLILDKKPILIPTITYILQKIENRLDGTPAILVLDEAWGLLDNYALGPKLKDLLKRFREKNCVIVFATKSGADLALSNIKDSLYGEIATQIFLPDDEPTEYYKTVFGLNDEECNLLTQMSVNERHFLLKHGDESIISTLDLSNTHNITAIFSSTKNTLFAMDEIKKRHGTDPKVWVPEFLKLIDKISKPKPVTTDEG